MYYKINSGLKKTVFLLTLAINFFVVFSSKSYAAIIDLSQGSGIITCTQIAKAFQNIINLMVSISGIVFFIMMVVGGAMYLLSAGNPEGVKRAQQTLIWGVVGTVATVGMVFIATTLLSDILGINLGTQPILDISHWICG